MTGSRLRTAAPALLLCLAAGCSLLSPGDRDGHDGTSAGVRMSAADRRAAAFVASPYWVDPRGPAARQAAVWRREGRTHDAALLERIARRPVALWPPADRPAPEVRRAVAAAAPGGRTVVLVAHALPGGGCAGEDRGGTEVREYRERIDAFAGAIGAAPAVVIVEPGALADAVADCPREADRAARYALLADAVARLARQPASRVYLDAGDPVRFPDPARLVDPLQRAGLFAADGFALNVGGSVPTDALRLYGTRLSGLLRGTHFVVDTARNGEGAGPSGAPEPPCNPQGRALGGPPTTDTGNELLDAQLWVARPGVSDGTCGGGPPAGTWWPAYALGLAARAAPGAS